MKNDPYEGFPEDYPCRACGMDCDEWDSRYCCTLCLYGLDTDDWDPDDFESFCEDCNPWDI